MQKRGNRFDLSVQQRKEGSPNMVLTVVVLVSACRTDRRSMRIVKLRSLSGYKQSVLYSPESVVINCFATSGSSTIVLL